MFTTSYGEEVAQKLGLRNGQIELMTRPTQTGNWPASDSVDRNHGAEIDLVI